MARVHAGARLVVLRIFVFFAPVAAIFEISKNAILSDLTAHLVSYPLVSAQYLSWTGSAVGHTFKSLDMRPLFAAWCNISRVSPPR